MRRYGSAGEGANQGETSLTGRSRPWENLGFPASSWWQRTNRALRARLPRGCKSAAGLGHVLPVCGVGKVGRVAGGACHPLQGQQDRLVNLRQTDRRPPMVGAGLRMGERRDNRCGVGCSTATSAQDRRGARSMISTATARSARHGFHGACSRGGGMLAEGPRRGGPGISRPDRQRRINSPDHPLRLDSESLDLLFGESVSEFGSPVPPACVSCWRASSVQIEPRGSHRRVW